MYLLFDIGGTKMRLAVSRDLKKLGRIVIVETPKNFNEGMWRFQEVASELRDGINIKAAAGGIAGVMDRNKTKLINSPNIRGWVNKPLKKSLEKAMRAAVFLENDADLAGLGEAVFGAGKRHKIVVYYTISTGIGGTRIIRGKIDESVMGLEPGHQIIFCGLDNSSETLEDCISGTAFQKRYKRLPREVSDKKIWDEAARVLALGLNNTIVHWSPDIVVLGGSMMKKIPVDRVRFYLKNILKIFPKTPLIKRASLGDLSGLQGAAILLKEKIRKGRR